MATTNREVYQSRWGFHPVPYETFCKLKTLHKRYWETVYAVARWVRWDRKTVHQIGEEPKYCPHFVIDKSCVKTYTNQEGFQGVIWYPKTLNDHGIIEAYHSSRMPKPTADEVIPLMLSLEEIEHLYQQVEAWMAEP